MSKHAILLFALSASVTSCGDGGCVEPDPGGNCGDWGCNTNAASLNGTVFFHELNLNRLPNDQNIQVIEFFRNEDGSAVKLVGDRLEGVQIGSVMKLMRGPREAYELTITGRGSTQFWVGGGRVETYKIDYRKLGSSEKPKLLCSGTAGDGGDPGADFRGEAIIFQADRGDRYDAKMKTLLPAPGADEDHGWFNIACSGFVTAKLHLLRHTAVAELPPTFTTKPSERQAMLKMLTADYCGGGVSFTETGHLLGYVDAHGFYDTTGGILQHDWLAGFVEAIWDEDGAMCLSNPRLGSQGLQRSEIDRVCQDRGVLPLPSCGDNPAEVREAWKRGYVFSMNPENPS